MQRIIDDGPAYVMGKRRGGRADGAGGSGRGGRVPGGNSGLLFEQGVGNVGEAILTVLVASNCQNSSHLVKDETRRI